MTTLRFWQRVRESDPSFQLDQKFYHSKYQFERRRVLFAAPFQIVELGSRTGWNERAWLGGRNVSMCR